MSSWTTLHISTINPYTLPSADKLAKAVRKVKKFYLDSGFDRTIVEDDIVLYVYGHIRAIEDLSAWNTNIYYIGKMKNRYCPHCKLDLKMWLHQINYKLTEQSKSQENTLVNQFKFDFYNIPIESEIFRCECEEQNPNEMIDHLLFGRFEIVDSIYSYWVEDYNDLHDELSLILDEDIISKVQISN